MASRIRTRRRCRATRSLICTAARRRRLRWLDGEHLRSGPARRQRLSEGPARRTALVPRRRHGRHPVHRVRGTGRSVDRSQAFAPFTTVNGKVWPVLDVQPATYRLRVINGSNARAFRLVLLRDNRPQLDRITQIGTDGGLLQTPVTISPQGLVLASAQRADLLVDFSDLEPGSELTLVNTARAPPTAPTFPRSPPAKPPTSTASCRIPRSCAFTSFRARRFVGGRLSGWQATLDRQARTNSPVQWRWPSRSWTIARTCSRCTLPCWSSHCGSNASSSLTSPRCSRQGGATATMTAMTPSQGARSKIAKPGCSPGRLPRCRSSMNGLAPRRRPESLSTCLRPEFDYVRMLRARRST